MSENLRLCNDGNAVIFFISTNYDTSPTERKIIGIYGNVKKTVLQKTPGFGRYDREGGFWTNMIAEQKYSLRFSTYLDARKYKPVKTMQRTPIRYIDKDIALQIISDAIVECNKKDRKKLSLIFELVSQRPYIENYNVSEQQKADVWAEKQTRLELLKVVRNASSENKAATKKTTHIRKREQHVLAAIRKLRGRQCQLCDNVVKMKNGLSYVEAAHIIAKNDGGTEEPNNIMVLCPNHHKEFDHGDVKKYKVQNNKFRFLMNGKKYAVNLSV